MATEKTTTLTFRIEPNIKEALYIAADRDRDHGSVANMVAVMIRGALRARGNTDPRQAGIAWSG